MSGLLQMVGDAVRNSPLVGRKNNTYSMTQAEDDDPFNRGLTFHVEYQGVDKLPFAAGAKGAEMSVPAIERVAQRCRPPFRKFSVLVTDKSLRLKDQATKQLVDDVPLYSISYCGTHNKLERTFCFIAKDADTDEMRIHVMRAADRAKAQAMIVTVSKAFNIAFLAWQAKQKQARAHDTAPGADSPRAQRRINELRAKQEKRLSQQDDVSVAAVTTKMAKATVTTEAPVPAAVSSNIDDDLDDMFTHLAESRSNPDLLENDIGATPTGFDWEQTKDHVDPNSTPNLLD
eukprot:scpid82961/ scgid8250/ Low density lipoprotein receptor adapter protein 1-B; Autosomal recessive hypercholesterolemia protein homolog beta